MGGSVGSTEGSGVAHTHVMYDAPYLVRVPARFFITVKHKLLSKLFHISVQHGADPRVRGWMVQGNVSGWMGTGEREWVDGTGEHEWVDGYRGT